MISTQKQERQEIRSALNLAVVSLFLIATFTVSSSIRVRAQETKSSYTLIQNGLLISGTGAMPVVDGSVLIHGDKIEAAGPSSHIKIPSSNVRIIDVNGAAITPGFIDAHVHLVSTEGNLLQFAIGTDWSYKVFKAAKNAQNTLGAGITTVRNLQGSPVGLKQAIREGLIAGPRIQLATTGIGGTGGHTDYRLPSGIDVVPAL
jgi:imidazolonepropionase-like amidohydrolase